MVLVGAYTQNLAELRKYRNVAPFNEVWERVLSLRFLINASNNTGFSRRYVDNPRFIPDYITNIGAQYCLMISLLKTEQRNISKSHKNEAKPTEADFENHCITLVEPAGSVFYLMVSIVVGWSRPINGACSNICVCRP